MVVAASYLIGLPVAIVGVLLLIAYKPIGDFFAAAQRAQAKWLAGGKDSVVATWLLVGTRDTLLSKLYRYGIVIVVGATFVLSGTAAVLGLWNPYE